MRRSSFPTLKDVAQEAGATVTAASVVLNGATSSARVSEAVRRRILDAADRLRYRRNAVALGLSRHRMNTIGVGAAIGSHDNNLYFLAVLNGVLGAAATAFQGVTVFSVPHGEAGAARVQEFCDGRIDGVILIAPHDPLLLSESLRGCPPVVTIHANQALPQWTNLDVDNAAGAQAATRYLLALGHRAIAHFSGPLSLTGAQQRLNGYRRAMAEANIPVDDSWVVPCEFNLESSADAMHRFLLAPRAGGLPTAIVCASDAIAYGCMEVLARHGIRVPQDMSVVGFDDTLMAQMTRPPLTTVRQPFDEMGRQAVRLVLREIDTQDDSTDCATLEFSASPDRQIVFAPELIARETTCPPLHPVAPTPSFFAELTPG